MAPERLNPGGSELSVEWQATGTCPSEDEFRAELSRRLGPSPQLSSSKRPHFRVDIGPTSSGDQGFMATIRMRSSSGLSTGFGRRSLQHPSSCAALTRGVALVIALTLTQQGDVEARPVPARRDDRRTSWHVDIQTAGLVSTGLFPGNGGGISLRSTASRGVLAFGMGAQYFFPARQSLPQLDAVETEFQAWSLELYSGYRWRVGSRLQLPLLLGLQYGQLYGRARGFVGAGRSRAPWWSVSVELGVRLRLTRWLTFVGGLQPFVGLRRPYFDIGGVGQVHRPAAFGVRASLGISLRFPAWKTSTPATNHVEDPS